MAKLFYCNTVYDYKPPQDLNPLILHKYKRGQILALCARDAMVVRISRFIQTDWYRDKFPDQVLIPYGWWEADKMGLLDNNGRVMRTELDPYDAVVIVARDRVDKMFHPLMKTVERYLQPNLPKSCG